MPAQRRRFVVLQERAGYRAQLAVRVGDRDRHDRLLCFLAVTVDRGGLHGVQRGGALPLFVERGFRIRLPCCVSRACRWFRPPGQRPREQRGGRERIHVRAGTRRSAEQRQLVWPAPLGTRAGAVPPDASTARRRGGPTVERARLRTGCRGDDRRGDRAGRRRHEGHVLLSFRAQGRHPARSGVGHIRSTLQRRHQGPRN